MNLKNNKIAAVLFVVALGSGCTPPPPQLLGTLEWDRAAVLAEVSEPVIAIEAQEGQAVTAGQLLLKLDPRRSDAELAGAQAEVARLTAQLAELRHGVRAETIDAQRAQLQKAQSDAANAQRDRERAASLAPRNLIAKADLDRAENTARMANADLTSTRAQLQESLHGTRPEQLDQAQAALAQAQANAQLLQLRRDRLDVRAPRAGKVDALPYRLGDQPPVGATLASLLVGKAPFARVYVPESRRAALAPGQSFQIHIDGISQTYTGTLRSIRSDASFTPYYGLTGADASRLSYRAELVLQDDNAPALPAGLPCQAEPSIDAKH